MATVTVDTEVRARKFYQKQLSEARARIRERVSSDPELAQPDFAALDAVIGDVEKRLTAGATNINEAASTLVFSDWWPTQPVGSRRLEVEVN